MVDVRANELDEGGYLQRVHSERIPASTKDDEEEGEGIDSLGWLSVEGNSFIQLRLNHSNR